MAGTLHGIGTTVGWLDRTLVERVSRLPASAADDAFHWLSRAASNSKLWPHRAHGGVGHERVAQGTAAIPAATRAAVISPIRASGIRQFLPAVWAFRLRGGFYHRCDPGESRTGCRSLSRRRGRRIFPGAHRGTLALRCRPGLHTGYRRSVADQKFFSYRASSRPVSPSIRRAHLLELSKVSQLQRFWSLATLGI
jgi:hypothetical protein